MVQPNAPAEIYRLHILLLQINPPIWRRLHVPSDSSIAMLHDLLPIAFDWSDFHLHRFVIRGKEYGVSRMGCTTFTTDARKGLLSQFGFRVNERFLYVALPVHGTSKLWKNAEQLRSCDKAIPKLFSHFGVILCDIRRNRIKVSGRQT
jgi:hypothetical protein